jgi:hypothetical protein
MRKQLFTVGAVLLLSAAFATAQSTPPPSRPNDESQPATAFNPSLIGTWRSAADQMKLTDDFEKSVWGADASSVRTTELVVRQSGEATLKITKSVVDARGRALPASTWVEEAQLQIGAGRDGVATRVEHDAKVVSAVRLFPDDKDYRWPLEGLRVKVVTFRDGNGGTIEIRYDTPEGRGSFWETLRRQAGGRGAAR